MKIKKEIKEHWVCDICGYQRKKTEINHLYRSWWDWFRDSEKCERIDICKPCLREIKLLMPQRRAKEGAE
jgi:hypothetical protein